MNAVRTLARPLLAGSLVASGVTRLRHADETAEHLAPTLAKVNRAVPAQARPYLRDEKLVARVIGGAQVGAGILLAAGKLPRLASAVLISTQAVNTLVEHKASENPSTPAEKNARTQNLLKNLSLLGAVMLATVDTQGQPGLAWRAEHLGEQAKRQAYFLGQDVKFKALGAQQSLLQKAQQAQKAVASA
jgi:uncharacterized membrane protein YphA (DoxX/SURF4 family)